MKEKFSYCEFNCFDINDHGSPKIPGLYMFIQSDAKYKIVARAKTNHP